MKPWGSQVTWAAFFPLLFPATEKMASRGSRGTAMSPPGRRTDAATCLLHGCLGARLPMPPRLGGALDYSGFGLIAASRPSHPDTPRRPFVQAVLAEGSPLPGTDKAAS